MVARRPVQARAQRSPTNWSGVVATGLIAVPALTKVLVTTAVPSFVSGETIRRIRGTLLVNGTAFFHGAIGAYVANDRAVLAGVASLLDPVTEVGDDAWFWYQSFHGSGAGSGSAGSLGSQVLTIDSKAMRRVSTGYQVVFVVGNASATLAFNIALSLRLLGSEAS